MHIAGVRQRYKSGMRAWLQRLLRGIRSAAAAPPQHKNTDNDAPQDTFARINQTYTLLLTAWNSFQDTLSHMEYTLCCERPFGMHRVCALTTAVVTRTVQCIHLLDKIDASHTNILRERFSHIQETMSPLLEESENCLLGPDVFQLDQHLCDSPHAALLPHMVDKAVIQLLRLRENLAESYPHLVPPCFAVTAAGTQRMLHTRGLDGDISSTIQKAGGITPRTVYKISTQLRKMIEESSIPAQLAQSFLEGVHRLRTAVGRTPAYMLFRGRIWQEDVDSADHGLLIWGPAVDLYAPDYILFDALRQTIANKYSPQSMMYRRWRGMLDSDASLCVLCMAIPHAHYSGLIHTMNPMQSSRGLMHLYAWKGLPAAAEDAHTRVDTWHILRRNPHSIQLSMPYDPAQPVIQDTLTAQIATIALQCEAAEGGIPLSLQWILRPDGNISLVMVRPMILSDRMEPEALEHSDIPTPVCNWGITASAGIASGAVRHVYQEADAKNFAKGDILVVANDAYAWATLLDRAAGVIVQKGFLGSRLASMCREFGIPALFDVPDCQSALAEGSTVTLWADTGCVYPGAVPELIAHTHPLHDYLPHSQVYHALQKIASMAAPLTMLPDTPDFRAKNCQTLHDISRYCYEKAVSAIFDMGVDRSHAPTKIKQLFDGIPKQFWLMDLEDVFDPAAQSSPCIDINQVRSQPFHALWYGMNVEVWGGPPPIDNKGFMSILYEATVNPNIEPATQGAYFSEKNYFMLGREYCNLYSRFGFHFVAVEGRLGAHKTQNFIVFQLRGGAADMQRRILRIGLVADILWECGFEPSIHHDALRARSSSIDASMGCALLSVLGYLTIHTRQLDMIMADKRQSTQRKDALLTACKKLLLTPPEQYIPQFDMPKGYGYAK